MSALASKQDIVRIVTALPDDISLDDVIERLILLRKVNTGLAQEGQGFSHADVVAEFQKPRAERRWNRG